MTDAQKEQVRAMRMQGIGYRLIAKSLGLKINQVQLFCKAHGLAGNGELARLNYPSGGQQNSRCPVCGAECEWIYVYRDGDAAGCDRCLSRRDAWKEEACAGNR